MPGRVGPQLSNDDLDRLARQWFAEARAQDAEKPADKNGGDAVGEAGADLLDWMFGDGDGASDDGGGD